MPAAHVQAMLEGYMYLFPVLSTLPSQGCNYAARWCKMCGGGGALSWKAGV
jgi:hypothetical protein